MRTYVFDAGALIAFFEDKTGAEKIESLLLEARRGHTRILISALNYGEVYLKLLRDHGRRHALQTMSGIVPFPIEVQDINAQQAFRAAEVKDAYKLYYIDAFAAALAMEHKATLVTSDSDFRKLGHSIPILWLRSH